MNILYIYAHPNPHSLNAKLKDIACDFLQGDDIVMTLSDLYQEHWQAVASYHDFTSPAENISYLQAQKAASNTAGFSEDIAQAQANLLAADHIILQFPLWWFSVPAIVKGWFDRVLAKGVAYDSGSIFEKGKLVGKTASFTVTTQSPENAYQATGIHGDTLENFLRPLMHTLRFTGIKVIPSHFIYDALTMPENRFEIVKQDYGIYLKALLQNIKK